LKKRNGIMTFRLPEDEKAKLQSFADAADCSLSDLAVKAIRDFMSLLEAAQAPAPKAPAPKKKKA
jgi:predicted transcriptional regulator